MKRTINELVAEFAESVVQQNEAIRRRDPVTGNEYADRYTSAFRQLLARGGVDALAVLFDDGREDVRTMAAAFLISHKTEDAINVLRESARGVGIVA